MVIKKLKNKNIYASSYIVCSDWRILKNKISFFEKLFY